MYKKINAEKIVLFLRTLVPDVINREIDLSDDIVEKLERFIEKYLLDYWIVDEISDISVLRFETAEYNKYLLTTRNQYTENKRECFFVVCLDGSCNVSLLEDNFNDEIQEQSGFLMQTNICHVILAKETTLFTFKFAVKLCNGA
ncbi:ORF-132 [Teiidae poxvirus 1]|nr:ORF-132 [Teiidae poxvirus 1]